MNLLANRFLNRVLHKSCGPLCCLFVRCGVYADRSEPPTGGRTR